MSRKSSVQSKCESVQFNPYAIILNHDAQEIQLVPVFLLKASLMQTFKKKYFTKRIDEKKSFFYIHFITLK